MTATTPKRPPMLTATCLYLGLFALIQSITAVDLISTWNGENSADRVSTFLDALRDAGVSQAGAESGYKAFLTVMAVMAAAGVVFAIYTARGDRASRIGLTVVMVFVGFCSFAGATGGAFFDVLLGALSVAFTIRLWRGEAKVWFHVLAGGEPPAPAPVAEKPRVDAFAGSSAPAVPSAPVAWEQPAPQSGAPQPVQRVNGRPRPPKSVRIATWTTLISSSIVATGSAMAMMVLGLVGSEDYEQILRDSPFSESLLNDAGVDYAQLYRTSMTVVSLCLALSLAGLAASIQVLSRPHKGDVFLFVMAVVTVITSILLFPIGLPFLAAAIVVLVQLRKRDSRTWFVKT